jgi:hypothetical protein
MNIAAGVPSVISVDGFAGRIILRFTHFKESFREVGHGLAKLLQSI